MTSANSSVRFFVSSSAVVLAECLASFNRTATVEAEFGDSCVQGSIRTLAHHGARSHNQCPCLHYNEYYLWLDAVGLSHLDLDAIGGVMALLGCKPEQPVYCPSFWGLAAYVDLNGPHRIPVWASGSDLRALHAWWAWSEAHRVSAPRDGSALDITSQVWEAIDTLTRILAGDESLLAQGDVWARAQESLESDSYVESLGTFSVLLREHEKFVNHLYSHDSIVFHGIVGFNPEKGTVTLSLENPSSHPRVSCAAIAKELWGDQAGGHPGIAGSPREGGLTLDDARHAAQFLNAVLCNDAAEERARMYDRGEIRG